MRYTYLLIIIVFSALLLRINQKLFSGSAQPFTERDIILQLNFLEDQLKRHQLGKEMQSLFPEGFVFVHALYGLTWCELAVNAQANKTLHNKAIYEALYAYDQITSKQAQETFDPHLFPENGIFYSGWSNYLLSKILLADTAFVNYSVYKNQFQRKCAAIEEAMNISKTPFLESYQDQAWPADMMLAVASLRNHDRIFKPGYSDVVSEWINRVKEKLDPATQMIPHKVDAVTGKSTESARGGSMALMLRMLAEIDPEFALSQYRLFKHNFISTALTLPCIREYPKGSFGIGDIDSGPVILGVGFPATLVSIGVLPMFGDQALAAKMYYTVNAFGFETVNGNQKKYLFGKLPMADAFIAWSSASGLKYVDENAIREMGIWAWPFHVLSLVCLLLIWSLYFRKALKTLYYRLILHPNEAGKE